MTPTKKHPRSRGAARPREEGAAMIVVMLVLLAATSLAVFAVHATTFEVRAAGHTRQGMQSQYVAETGLNAAMAMMDTNGPQGFLYSIRATAADPTLDKPELMPFEPSLADDKDGYRMYMDDMTSFGALPVDAEALGGNRTLHQPTFIVDLNDHYTYTGAVPGQRADGHGRLQYLHATYTSRGRMRLDPVRVPGEAVDGSGRTYHEAASDARAHGLTGPFGR